MKGIGGTGVCCSQLRWIVALGRREAGGLPLLSRAPPGARGFGARCRSQDETGIAFLGLFSRLLALFPSIFFEPLAIQYKERRENKKQERKKERKSVRLDAHIQLR